MKEEHGRDPFFGHLYSTKVVDERMESPIIAVTVTVRGNTEELSPADYSHAELLVADALITIEEELL